MKVVCSFLIHVLLIVNTGCAQLPDSTAFPQGNKVSPPGGWRAYCYRKPKDLQCLSLNDSTWSLLNRVNKRVNRIPYQSDYEKFQREYWDQSGQDCEDYALRKRDSLAKLGVPISAMGIATAYTRENIYHAVLAVHTDRGVYILDNLRNKISPWDALPYRWVSYFDPVAKSWVKPATGRNG